MNNNEEKTLNHFNHILFLTRFIIIITFDTANNSNSIAGSVAELHYNNNWAICAFIRTYLQSISNQNINSTYLLCASKEWASNKTLNDEITCLLIQPRVANKRRDIQNKGRNHVTKIDMYIFLQHYALALSLSLLAKKTYFRNPTIMWQVNIQSHI